MKFKRAILKKKGEKGDSRKTAMLHAMHHGGFSVFATICRKIPAPGQSPDWGKWIR
jgi:hypothetical protein